MEFEEESAVLVNMADMALLFGRLLLSLLFLEEGIELASNLDTALEAMARLGVTAPSPLPPSCCSLAPASPSRSGL
ncbi:putative membrane protein YphA (DoxX/SURF4 family) [Rhizobium miluonense]|uniref:Membrane protein YphA (DoxX/SURF4 family) n=1 Tax=Rhizobium miluonense TaxID=411945 RepID=A0ABU1SQF1_9HYPH|nr:putative membrane protein YphA (DoxX/SURF4 family) [Rhizobium miluonense]